MAEKAVVSYKSHRNRVELTADRRVVKTFREEAAFQRELAIYRLLQEARIPCAQVLLAECPVLTLSHLPGKNLVECLEQQEENGQPLWEVWEQLAEWMLRFHRCTGFVMTDVNLRNFLYDESSRSLYGLDFEECETGSLLTAAAELAAFIRTYRPEYTPLKLKISQYLLEVFAQKLDVAAEVLVRESARREERILQRRRNKK